MFGPKKSKPQPDESVVTAIMEMWEKKVKLAADEESILATAISEAKAGRGENARHLFAVSNGLRERIRELNHATSWHPNEEWSAALAEAMRRLGAKK